MAGPNKHSRELRDRAVQLVLAVAQTPVPAGGHPIGRRKIGCTVETLRRWVRQADRDLGRRQGLTTDERQRMKDLEREVFELKRTNEILRKASAYFAQAELDRRPK